MKIRNLFSEFFLSIDFKLKGSENSEYFGDFYDSYTNGYLIFRLVSDRSIISIDISIDMQNWYDLALVKSLMYNETNINYITNIEESIKFLQNEFANITELFNDVNFFITKTKLEKLANERAKQMFPDAFQIIRP